MRDDESKRYFVYEGCKRKWLNDNDENDGKNYGSSGINFLWPITEEENFKDALKKVQEGRKFNNISPIFTYSLQDGITVMWMGDMESDFLDKIKDMVEWPSCIDILFAPHHGRDSGKVSSDVLKKLNPKIIVIGNAPSEYINYYSGYNTITQNSAGDITFVCDKHKTQVYVSNKNYSVNFLKKEKQADKQVGNYIGSF